MVACGALTLPHTTGLAAAHAAAFIFYGARLILFLLYREICLPVSVHQMAQREATLKERLKRAPVILGCAFLYFCMAAPLRVTALSAPTLGPLAAAAIAMMWIGISLAAVGDTWKSIVKARKGADALVTGGPFAIFRHPNYTGEVCAREPTTLLVACVTPPHAFHARFGLPCFCAHRPLRGLPAMQLRASLLYRWEPCVRLAGSLSQLLARLESASFSPRPRAGSRRSSAQSAPAQPCTSRGRAAHPPSG